LHGLNVKNQSSCFSYYPEGFRMRATRWSIKCVIVTYFSYALDKVKY